MGDLIEILRQKAAGQRNKVGDLWADWVCERAADELARLRAEVAENKREIDELVRAVNLGSERAKKAERERDELRRRIAEAERFDAAMLLALGIPVSQDDAFAAFALVRLDAEEGK